MLDDHIRVRRGILFARGAIRVPFEAVAIDDAARGDALDHDGSRARIDEVDDSAIAEYGATATLRLVAKLEGPGAEWVVKQVADQSARGPARDGRERAQGREGLVLEGHAVSGGAAR